MAVIAALSVIAALFWLGAVGGLGLAGYNASRGLRARPGVILFIIGLVGGILLTLLNAGLVLVETNERAIVFRQVGGSESALRDEALTPGLNWIFPFVEDTTTYNVGRQNVTMAGSAGEAQGQAGVQSGVRGRSNDGQELIVDVTVLYTVNPLEVNKVHVNWRNTYQQNFIVAQTRSVLRDKIADFSAEEIFSGGRTALQANTADVLGPTFEEEGFTLIDLLVRDVTFAPEFADAIERKQIAEQEAQRAVFLVQQQEQEAERARAEAEGLADAEAIRAEGEARANVLRAEGEREAIILRAEGDAEALRLVNEQIANNPALIQFRYIQELGDNVDLILLPSNSPFLFDLETLTNASRGGSSSAPIAPPPAPPADGG